MMPITLILVSQMVKGGFPAHFEQTGCKILTPSKKTLAIIAEKNGLYPLVENPSISSISESAFAAEPSGSTTLFELHRRMGHTHSAALKKMVDNEIVDGISLTNTDVPFCETCVKAKQTTKPFPQERSSPPMTAYGQRVHSDVWGKASVKSLGGNEYFVTFLDDYSDEAMVVPMKKKSEVFDRFKEYEALLKRQRGVDGIKELQSDRGGEYTSNEFTEHLKKQGTVRRLTTHDSPQQNGKAERLNLTLVEHSRCMLLNSGLPKFLWAEAVKHAAYLRNRTTTKTTLGSTPHERATKTKPNLGRIPRFGQEVLVLIDAASKLDPKSKTARWIGFDDESKGHKVYWPDKQSVSVERNLMFVPDSSPEVV